MLHKCWGVGLEEGMEPVCVHALFDDERLAWAAFGAGPNGTVIELHENGIVVMLAVKDI